MRKEENVLLTIIATLNFGQKVRQFVIVETHAGKMKNSFTYDERNGRELLAACFVPEKNKLAHIGVDKIEIKSFSLKNKKLKLLIPRKITVLSNGYTTEAAYGLSFANLLFYSQNKKRYECIRALCWEGKYYIDDKIYQEFVWTNGNPGVETIIHSHKMIFQKVIPEQEQESLVANINEKGNEIGEDNAFELLKNESILRKHGYCVGKKQRLSRTVRQQILTDIINKGVCRKKTIISLLTFFIKCHTGEQYSDARKKWKEDIDYLKKI